jgi:TolA-binding protein
MMLIEKLHKRLMKIKIAEKIILDRKHQNIIAALNQKIEKLETDNKEMANIEKQHQYMNGELHKEITKLNKKIEELKKENTIFKEHLQAEMLKPKKS